MEISILLAGVINFGDFTERKDFPKMVELLLDHVPAKL